MKRFIILMLICANLALVAILAFHARPAKAYAQRRRGAGDYVTITGRRRSSDDVLYVIDSQARVMFGFWPDTSRGDLIMVPLGPRDLERDFPIGSR